MKIIVKEENRKKIEETLQKVNGRATARIIDYDGLVQIVKAAREHIAKYCGQTKKALAGAKVYYSPNCQLPSSYKYPASGTDVEFIFGSDGLARLVNVDRCYIDKSTDKQYHIIYTEEQKNEMLWLATRF